MLPKHTMHIRKQNLLALLIYIIFFEILAGIGIAHFTNTNTLFANGLYYYEIVQHIQSFTPIYAHIFLITCIAISAIIVFSIGIHFKLNTYIAWVVGIIYSLTPIFFQIDFSLIELIFSFIGLPGFLLLYISIQHKKFGRQIICLWTLLWIFALPLSSIIFIIMILTSRKWAMQYVSHKKTKLAQKNPDVIYSILFTYIICITIELFITYLLRRYVWSLPFTINLPGEMNSVSFRWIINFPLDAFFSLWRPFAFNESSTILVPALVISTIGIIFILKKYNTGKEKYAMYWFAHATIIALILSMGSYIRTFRTIFPSIPLPGILLSTYNFFTYIPLLFVPLALLNIICIFIVLLAKINIHKYQKTSFFVCTIVLILFLTQYFVCQIPTTFLYKPSGYDAIVDKPETTQVLEINNSQHINAFKRIRFNAHKQMILGTETPFGEKMADLLGAGSLPFIPQNSRGDYTTLFFKKNIIYIDFFKKNIVNFSPLLKNNFDIPDFWPMYKNPNVIEKTLDADKIFEDNEHIVYKIRHSSDKEGLLTFSKAASWAMKAEKKKNTNSYDFIKMVSGAKMYYFNFSNETQAVNINMDVNSKRAMNLSIVLDGQIIQSEYIPEQTKNKKIQLKLEKIGAGDHEIEFKMTTQSGKKISNINTLSVLQVNKVDYDIESF